MKFATINAEGKQLPVIAEEGRVLLLNAAAEKKDGTILPGTLAECLKEEGFLEKARAAHQWALSQEDQDGLYLAADKVKWEAPIPRPMKNVFCVGKNYAEHAIEMGSKEDIPETMIIFTKAPTTVIGHQDPIPGHRTVTDQLDYEGELAVVIGKTGLSISKDEALDYVFGYTILNDVTARDLQSRHKQYFLGKSLDGSCPMGPYIVDKSEIPDPGRLKIETKVNGEVRQSSGTEQLIFPIEEIIEVISKGTTLEAGDIIATGTPAGVGKGMKPPKFLQEGDRIEITIENIGTLSNTVH